MRITLKNVVLLFLFTTMNSRITTKIQIFLLKQIARLPFWLIYFLSDIFYLVVFYLVGYRRNVVQKNLKKSFPEKSEQELKSVSKKFYRHFCDFSLETIKMSGMTEDDFKKRVKVKNADLVNQYFENGRSVVVLTMHYNNWEWAVFISTLLKHTSLAVYKPLQDLIFDRYMNKTRSRFGTELIKNEQVLRRVLAAEKTKEPVFLWLAGDQTPPVFHKSWYLFLNQEALFYPGPAFITRRFNYPVFFQKIEKKSRGIYETTFELLFENPAEVSESEIIKRYILKMEEIIREQPEFYLWSHKRWKHKKPAGVAMQ